MKIRTTAVGATLLLFGAVGCADLDIDNPNAPITEEALGSPGDVESLIQGSFVSWWRATQRELGLAPAVHVAAGGHSAYPANFGMVDFTRIPRPTITNDPSWSFYSEIQYTWTNLYGALNATRDGLTAIDAGVAPANAQRAEAFARFVQGLAHASLAAQFDQAFIVDETTPLTEDGLPDVEPSPYTEVLAAAMGYFDQAIALAQDADGFPLSSTWMSREMNRDEFIRIINSYKARYRAAIARNPDERQAVDWNAVLADIDAGITSDHNMTHDGLTTRWSSTVRVYGNFPGWGQVDNHYLGMADQSGGYQDWVSTAIDEREPFLYETPDLRFPQGETRAEQEENCGLYFVFPTNPAACPATLGSTLGDQHARPDRGTWRWSYYRDNRHDVWLSGGYIGDKPEISHREMRLLAAEAHYHLGNTAEAVAIVDETRVERGGLDSAAGDNESCVPRLPDGSCGDLMEMIKWEYRTELSFPAQGWLVWYNHRAWGDLIEGTFIHFPIPSRELTLLGREQYTTGGVGQPGGAPSGTYGF